MRAISLVAGLGLLSGISFGQTAEATAKIELADVHAAAKSSDTRSRISVPRGGRWELHNITLVELIGLAYKLDADRIVGGPNWLEEDRFDVIAKVPPGILFEKAAPMLQGLLADRFGLVVRNDTKLMPTYVLGVGKGKPKLRESAGGASDCNGGPENPEKGNVMILVKCTNMTMETFAQQMRGVAGYVSDNLVDKTGLKGGWDFEFRFTARAFLPQAGADGITLSDAFEKQLGLKLEQQKTELPVLVIEKVNQTPTGNPPGIQTSLPPPAPTEFEVADIKPTLPDQPGQNADFRNGRLDVHGFTLKRLVMAAWQITSDDFIAAPKWMETARFDIVAKVCADAAACPQADDEALGVMIKSMLQERFKLKTHMEDRMVSAYTLLAVKPKLKRADPSNRTGCHEGGTLQGQDPRDKNPVLSRLITCQNMTTAQFAAQLQKLASGYVKTQVVDATELEGAWDFTVNFSPFGALQQAGAPRDGASGAASDPSGALSLPDAINKQLGLKLEVQKRMLPVLVIDHIEEKPTDN